MNISKSYKIPEAIKLKKYKNEDHRFFCVVPRKAFLNRSVSGENLRVLAVLASYCNRSGYSYVSLKTLASDLQCSQQNVSKHLIKLEKAGIIESWQNCFSGLKGNTRRIIYNEKIKHDDLKHDALSNSDILEIQKHTRLLDQIEKNSDQPNRVDRSENHGIDYQLACLEYMTSEAELLAFERAIQSGSDPKAIFEHLSHGIRPSEAILSTAK